MTQGKLRDEGYNQYLALDLGLGLFLVIVVLLSSNCLFRNLKISGVKKIAQQMVRLRNLDSVLVHRCTCSLDKGGEECHA